MKSISIKMYSLILLSLITIGLISCKGVEIRSSVLGKTVATPSTVKNGDNIVFSIGGLITSSSSVTVNGKNYYPIVHYLIDGEEAVVSTEKETPFKAEYKVENLAVGEHTLSVSISSSDNNAMFENEVLTSIFTVIE